MCLFVHKPKQIYTYIRTYTHTHTHMHALCAYVRSQSHISPSFTNIVQGLHMYSTETRHVHSAETTHLYSAETTHVYSAETTHVQRADPRIAHVFTWA